VLGVDETSVRKRHKQYALVLSDLERRAVIDVLPKPVCQPERHAREAVGQLDRRRTAGYQSRFDRYVEALSVCRQAGRQAVRKKLPHAEIVADRFHVMKQLNHQIDLLRRALQKKADDALYQVLKGNRWLLLKNRSELKPEEEAKPLVILDASDDLRTTYLLKGLPVACPSDRRGRQELRTICDKINDRGQAERLLRAWMWKAMATGSRYLIRFVKTLRNWWHELLNYLDDRVTQGFVEGINRAIRGIINRAFGFRDFHNFRLQVLVECGGTCTPRIRVEPKRLAPSCSWLPA